MLAVRLMHETFNLQQKKRGRCFCCALVLSSHLAKSKSMTDRSAMSVVRLVSRAMPIIVCTAMGCTEISSACRPAWAADAAVSSDGIQGRSIHSRGGMQPRVLAQRVHHFNFGRPMIC